MDKRLFKDVLSSLQPERRRPRLSPRASLSPEDELKIRLEARPTSTYILGCSICSTGIVGRGSCLLLVKGRARLAEDPVRVLLSTDKIYYRVRVSGGGV